MKRLCLFLGLLPLAISVTPLEGSAISAASGDSHALYFVRADVVSDFSSERVEKGSAPKFEGALIEDELVFSFQGNGGSYASFPVEVESGKTYTLIGDYTCSEASGVAFWIDPGSAWVQGDLYDAYVNGATSTYRHFRTDYTPTANGTVSIVFQNLYSDPASVHEVHIRNLQFAEKVNVTEDGVIGALPALPASTERKRYDYWEIDGEEIASDSVYVYAEDKIALPHLTTYSALTFQVGDGEQGYNAINGSSCDTLWSGLPSTVSLQNEGERGGIFLFDGTSGDAFSTPELQLFASSKYELSFDAKVENASSLVFSTFLNESSPYCAAQDKVTALLRNNSDWQTVTKTLTFQGGDSLTFSTAIGFRFYGGSGSVRLDNISLHLVETTRYLQDQEPVGELPGLSSRQDAEAQYWKMDGEEITSTTLFEGGEDKIATTEYTEPTRHLDFAIMDFGSEIETNASSDSKLEYESENGSLRLTHQGNFASTYSTLKFPYASGVSYSFSFDYSLDTGVSLDVIFPGKSTSALSSLLGTGSVKNLSFVPEQATDEPLKLKIKGSGSAVLSSFYCVDSSLQKEVHRDEPVGTLPEFGIVPEGKIASWVLGGVTLQNDTIYPYSSDSIALKRLTSEMHRVTLKDEAGEILSAYEIAYGENLMCLPQIDPEEGYDIHYEMNGTRVERSDLFVSHEDVTIVLVRALVTYTATFIANEKIIEAVPFTILDESIAEPFVPTVDGCRGYWEEYELKAQDIEIHAVYETGTYYLTVKESRYGKALRIVPFHFGDSLESAFEAFPESMEKEGYRFLRYEIDGEEVSPSSTYRWNENKSLYPVYEVLVTPPSEEEPEIGETPEHAYAAGVRNGTFIGLGSLAGLDLLGFGAAMIIRAILKKKGTK